VPVFRRSMGPAHVHAAAAKSRDFKIAFSKLAFFYCSDLRIALIALPNDFPVFVRIG
jgi:hypothetical protein